MKRTYFLLAACLLLSGVLFAVATNWFGRAPEYVAAAGTRYTVSVLPVDPLEVRVTSGDADTVTMAAVMPSMGHALPPVDTVQAEPGHFVAAEEVFVMGGEWELSITVSRTGGQEVITVSTVVDR
ncbi:LOW QUALITY PROTEIN: hypothetical protein FB390_3748 [Nocardia bhagyanarayanae]|uniref:YtkA-like protein n=1 Tax=Nocardia bhagyanarayanae TaxID=1215925 RepID=A0A543FE95_9NOCA|nr:LOW QUALITY PROTEIN: hypothetical protein FB390_3748 [Nocardia bhagyanarayanae]